MSLRIGHGLFGGQSFMRCGAGSRGQCGGLDVIELGEVLIQVGFTLLLNFVLVGASAAGRAFAVVSIKGVYDVHSVRDLAKRGETHAVQARVVSQIDKQLSGARVWTCGGEGEEVLFIALSYRVVFDGGLLPQGVQGRISADSKLRDETLEHAKKTLIIEK